MNYQKVFTGRKENVKGLGKRRTAMAVTASSPRKAFTGAPTVGLRICRFHTHRSKIFRGQKCYIVADVC